MNSINFLTLSTVLLIKPRGIGDVLLSTPVISNLKRHYPDLSIDYFCENFAADIVHNNPAVRNVVLYDRKKDSSFSLISKVRANKYDAVIDLYCNPRTALVTIFSGANYRIGFPFRGRSYAYNIHIPPRSGKVHNVEFNLDVLRYFNIPITNSFPQYQLTDADNEFADEWLTRENLKGKQIIGIYPSGGWDTKKWGLKSFAQLADSLAKWNDSNIVLLWGPGEEEDINVIQKLMKYNFVKIPRTSLKEMSAIISRCSYFIANDSGPMHIAAALGVPTLGIYGPTNPILQGPYGEQHMWIRHEDLDCMPCNLTECPIGKVCMNELSVERVFKAFKTLVSKNSTINGKEKN